MHPDGKRPRPKLLILRLFWPQTPHVCCRSKHPPVSPIYPVTSDPRSPRVRSRRSCSNTSHRSSSFVHALPHPASCPHLRWATP